MLVFIWGELGRRRPKAVVWPAAVVSGAMYTNAGRLTLDYPFAYHWSSVGASERSEKMACCASVISILSVNTSPTHLPLHPRVHPHISSSLAQRRPTTTWSKRTTHLRLAHMLQPEPIQRGIEQTSRPCTERIRRPVRLLSRQPRGQLRGKYSRVPRGNIWLTWQSIGPGSRSCSSSTLATRARLLSLLSHLLLLFLHPRQ